MAFSGTTQVCWHQKDNFLDFTEKADDRVAMA